MADHWDDENKVAWTRTWYGRKTPYTAEEVEKRVRAAFREARAHLTGTIWFSADEDAFFAGDESNYDPSPVELIDPVENEEQALEQWWNLYGSSDTEANLRELGFGPWIDKYGRGMIEEE